MTRVPFWTTRRGGAMVAAIATNALRKGGEETMTLARPILLAAGLLFCIGAAQAQSVADFYRGKTINVLIGTGVGGEYDLQARLVARHIGKHIPGNPNVVPQNMAGAGGI